MSLILGVIAHIVVNAALLKFFSVSLFPDNIFITGDLKGFLVIAVVAGVINAIIRPILLLLSLPIKILTLGLSSFAVNTLLIALLEWVVGSLAIEGVSFDVQGMIPYLALGFALAFAHTVVHHLAR